MARSAYIAKTIPRLSFDVCVALTVRLLPSCTGTATAKLLGLHTTGVGDQEGTVVGDEQLTELQGGGGVVLLGVVGDQGLGDGLAQGVDLRNVTTTRDTAANVNGAVVMKKWSVHLIVCAVHLYTHENLSSPTTSRGS